MPYTLATHMQLQSVASQAKQKSMGKYSETKGLLSPQPPCLTPIVWPLISESLHWKLLWTSNFSLYQITGVAVTSHQCPSEMGLTTSQWKHTPPRGDHSHVACYKDVFFIGAQSTFCEIFTQWVICLVFEVNLQGWHWWWQFVVRDIQEFSLTFFHFCFELWFFKSPIIYPLNQI